MSRTIKETKVLGKNVKETREYIEGWLSVNGFKIIEKSSKGKRKYVVTLLTFPGYLVSPKAGALVAVSPEIYGCIVFEITMKQDENYTFVHGEFYATGSTIMIGREWDLRLTSPIRGKIVRENGYDKMMKLFSTLEEISKAPVSV